MIAYLHDTIKTNYRHCEPTGRANARPMTGSAKQSIADQGKSGLLRRFRLRSLSYGGQVAPRNDDTEFGLPRPRLRGEHRPPSAAVLRKERRSEASAIAHLSAGGLSASPEYAVRAPPTLSSRSAGRGSASSFAGMKKGKAGGDYLKLSQPSSGVNRPPNFAASSRNVETTLSGPRVRA